MAERAPAYALSMASGALVSTDTANTFADGLAVRTPDPVALEVIQREASRIVQVSEDEMKDAVRAYFADTKNLAEGAGAAPLAAALKERERHRGRRIGVVLTGSNIDREVLHAILDAETA